MKLFKKLGSLPAVLIMVCAVTCTGRSRVKLLHG
jgi:hypothetical protein